MLGALLLKFRGAEAAEPVIGIASIVVGSSVLLFAWLIFTRIGAESRLTQPPGQRRVAT